MPACVFFFFVGVCFPVAEWVIPTLERTRLKLTRAKPEEPVFFAVSD